MIYTIRIFTLLLTNYFQIPYPFWTHLCQFSKRQEDKICTELMQNYERTKKKKKKKKHEQNSGIVFWSKVESVAIKMHVFPFKKPTI